MYDFDTLPPVGVKESCLAMLFIFSIGIAGWMVDLLPEKKRAKAAWIYVISLLVSEYVICYLCTL